MTCGIYLIKNKKTRQIYVGQSINIEKRFKQHCRKSSKEILVDQEINKYGKNNFSLEIIEELPRITELLIKRERYWIKYFNTFNNNFHYNNSPGGQYSVSKKNHPASIIKNGFRRGMRTYSIYYQKKKFFRTESQHILEEILKFFFDQDLQLLPTYNIDMFKEEGREFIKENMSGFNSKSCLWDIIEEKGGISFLKNEKENGKSQKIVAKNLDISPHVIYNYLEHKNLSWRLL